MRRKLKVIVPLLIAVVVAVAAIIYFKTSSPSTDSTDVNSYTGTEWLLMQDDILNAYAELAENYEEVYALYISGAMSPSDFVNELSVCQAELFRIQSEYTEGKSEKKINLTTAAEKEGLTAFEDIFVATNKMFTSSVSDKQAYTVEEVGYVYLSYKSVIEENFQIYSSALAKGGN